MSRITDMMDEVANRMGIQDVNDPRVQAEVDRLLPINHRRLMVIEMHPNSGGLLVGKMGTEREVMDYLTEEDKQGTLSYLYGILELKEGAGDEADDWIELDGCDPMGLRKVKIGASPKGTPPLPGLEKRLAGIQASAYGQQMSVWSLLQAMTDEEIACTSSETLHSLKQMGVELPKVGEPSCRT